MRTYYYFLHLLILLAVFPGCSVFQGQKKEVGLHFDKPEALFVSLKDERAEGAEEISKKGVVNADFWVQLNHPEIGAIGQDILGIPHDGMPTELMVMEDQEFEEISEEPEDFEWQRQIPEKTIEKGLVFLVKDRFEVIHKVKITQLDKKEESVNFLYESFPEPEDKKEKEENGDGDEEKEADKGEE